MKDSTLTIIVNGVVALVQAIASIFKSKKRLEKKEFVESENNEE